MTEDRPLRRIPGEKRPPLITTVTKEPRRLRITTGQAQHIVNQPTRRLGADDLWDSARLRVKLLLVVLFLSAACFWGLILAALLVTYG